jgi:hypothetical protein
MRPDRLAVESTILRGDDEWTVRGTVWAGGSEVELEEATGPRGEVHDWANFRHWDKRDTDTAEQALIDEAAKRWAARHWDSFGRAVTR